jgi:hypothetical protein
MEACMMEACMMEAWTATKRRGRYSERASDEDFKKPASASVTQWVGLKENTWTTQCDWEIHPQMPVNAFSIGWLEAGCIDQLILVWRLIGERVADGSTRIMQCWQQPTWMTDKGDIRDIRANNTSTKRRGLCRHLSDLNQATHDVASDPMDLPRSC